MDNVENEPLLLLVVVVVVVLLLLMYVGSEMGNASTTSGTTALFCGVRIMLEDDTRLGEGDIKNLFEFGFVPALLSRYLILLLVGDIPDLSKELVPLDAIKKLACMRVVTIPLISSEFSAVWEVKDWREVAMTSPEYFDCFGRLRCRRCVRAER